MPFGGLLTTSLIGLETKIGGAFIGSNAVGDATSTLSDAEKQVLDLINKTVPQANSLVSSGATTANDTLQKFYQQNLGLLAPYLQAGGAAEGQLQAGVAPGGQFNNGQPSADQVLAQDPGYQFRLQQGQLALDRSASSKGEALGGGQLKALTQYGQDYASQEYGAAFNRYNTTQTNIFNRLNAVAGTGLTAARTGVGAGTTTGLAESGNTMTAAGEQSNNLLSVLPQQGNAITGQAQAQATGTISQANILSNFLQGTAAQANGFQSGYQGQRQAKQDQSNFQQLLTLLGKGGQ